MDIIKREGYILHHDHRVELRLNGATFKDGLQDYDEESETQSHRKDHFFGLGASLDLVEAISGPARN